jgi:hypothetical protein
MAGAVRGAEKNCIFIGDFNVPDIDWESGTTSGRSRELLEAAEEKLMEQMVPFPTHVRGNTLDLVLTDIPERVTDVRDEGRLGGSDHVIITCKIVTKAGPQQAYKAMPDWNKADWDSIKRELAREDWDEKMYGLNTEQAWNLLRSKLHCLIEKHVPPRRRRNHNRPPWLSREILRAIRKKKRLWRLAKQGQKVDEYREAEKSLKNMIRNAKRKFERGIAKGCGSERVNKRRFYSYIKQRTKSRPGIGPLRDGQGKTVQSDKEMTKLLNRFFAGVFTREDTANIPDPQPTGCRQELRGVNISVRAVKQKIRKLRTDGAAGPDGLGPLVLKKLADQIAEPLALVMRTSLREGAVPEDWRTANITPIFKKGQK